MSDKIRVKPEDLDRVILEDIQHDLVEIPVEETVVPVPEVSLDVKDNDNSEPTRIEWETGGPTSHEASTVSDDTGKLRDSSFSTAESVSSQGYNPAGNSNADGVPATDSGLKKGTSVPGSDEAPAGTEAGSDYDDSPAGNGYRRNRAGNQTKGSGKSDEKPEEEKPGDKKDPKTQGDKTKGEGTPDVDPDGEGTKGKPKTDLEKDKPLEDALDKAATDGMVANSDQIQGGKPGDASKTGDQEGEQPEKKASPDETGNGYGALDKKKQPAQNDPNDATARARRNLEHQNRVNNGDSKPVGEAKKKPASSSSTPKTGSPVRDALAKAGNNLKNKAKNLGKKKDEPSKKSGNEGSDTVDKGLGALKNALVLFMKSHPVLSIGIILVIILLIIFMIDTMEFNAGGRGRGKRSCTYTLNGVTSTGTVELSNLKVEIINCDGKADNYEVLDTVDFEKYILGVALAEAGASSPDEALKAQMIAVRNFTLTRNSGMCPSHPESCFHGYNESTGIIRMRACTNDQVYWDYTKDCPKIERAGQPTLYCEGVDGSTDIWKKALSEERQKEVEALANEVMGEVLLDENGNVLKLGYQADETDKFIADANAGKSYVEILEGVYGSSSYSSAKCTYGGVFDYGDYTLSSENTSILHEPLDEFLEDNGTSLEEFNELIADNVDDAGWGTRAGVVAAAVTLIGELGDNYGVKVPYYWGGGHYDGVVDGALGYWGSTQCHTYANNQHYNYCGFDCSGFVPWAIKNGGFKKGVDLASNFQNMPNARRVKLTNQPELQPGDLLESDGHIVLVVGIDEASGQYICAEAMGNAYGVLFTRRAFNESGYWGVDLEDYYNDPNYIREPIR